MHATIPALPGGIQHILQAGFERGEANGKLADLLDRTEGVLLANGMAAVIKLGFTFLAYQGVNPEKARKARQFFDENFIMKDPNRESGYRYYQGQFLIRTRKPADDMNVWIRFCPDPDTLYLQTPFGERLNPAAIVTTRTLSETEAGQIEQDPDRCDLVIRFRDSRAILGMLERPDADVVQLLLENLVQITGNFGHMFKFGAIGKNIQLMMEQDEA